MPTNTTTTTIFSPSLRTPQKVCGFQTAGVLYLGQMCQLCYLLFTSLLEILILPYKPSAHIHQYCCFFFRCKMFVFLCTFGKTGQDRTGLPEGPFPARHQYGRIAGQIGTVLSTWGSTGQDSFPPPPPVFLKKCNYIEDLLQDGKNIGGSPGV